MRGLRDRHWVAVRRLVRDFDVQHAAERGGAQLDLTVGVPDGVGDQFGHDQLRVGKGSPVEIRGEIRCQPLTGVGGGVKISSAQHGVLVDCHYRAMFPSLPVDKRFRVSSCPMPDAPVFSTERVGGEAPVCFRCVGELDIAGLAELRGALVGVDDDVALDFAAVTFLDSSGAGVLVAERQRLEASGHRLILIGVHGAPQRALEILGLLDGMT
jgi:anti-anti-sigma factor